MKKKFIISIVLLCIFICGFTWFLFQMKYRNLLSQLYTENFNLLEQDDSRDKDFSISVKTSEPWDIENDPSTYGAQYDFTFYNNSNCNLVDWTVSIDVPSDARLDGNWNGVYSVVDNKILINPVDYNKSIRPFSTIPFGCIIYLPKGVGLSTCSIDAHKYVSIYTMPFFWISVFILVIAFLTFIVYLLFRLRYRELQKRQEEYKSIINQAFDTFANTIEAKDPYTQGHSRRVCNYACMIAERMKLPVKEKELVEYASLLHDIGKVAVPDAILNKPGRLTICEIEKMHKHAAIGGEILKDFTSVPCLADIVRHHHERFDGKGYPDGLSGKDIPLVSRIICVADSYDAMTSTRCYKACMTNQEVISEFTRCNGKQFDPAIVIHLFDMIHNGIVPVSGKPA